MAAQPFNFGAKPGDFFFETSTGFGFFVLPRFGESTGFGFFMLPLFGESTSLGFFMLPLFGESFVVFGESFVVFGESFVVFGLRSGATFFREFLFEPQFVFDGGGQNVFAGAIFRQAQLRPVDFIRDDDPIQAEGFALRQRAALFAFDKAVFDAVPDGDGVLGGGIETDDFLYAAVLITGKLVGPDGGVAVGVAHDFNDEVGISVLPNVPCVEVSGIGVDLDKHIGGKTLFGVGGIVIDELLGADGDVATFPAPLGHDFVGFAKHQVQRGASFQVALAFGHAFLEGFLFAKNEVRGWQQRGRGFGGDEFRRDWSLSSKTTPRRRRDFGDVLGHEPPIAR